MMLLIIFIWQALLQSVKTYAIPVLNFQASIRTYEYSAYPSDRCLQMQLSNKYAARLGANNVLELFETGSRTSVGRLTNYTYSSLPNGTFTANLIHSMRIDSSEAYIAISLTTDTQVLYVPTLQVKQTTPFSQFYAMVFNNALLTGMGHTNTSTDQMEIFSKIKKAQTNGWKTTVPSISLNFVKNCKCSVSPDNSIMAFWDQSSNVFLYFNPNNGNIPSYMGKIMTNSSIPNLTQTITFSSDNLFMILETDDYQPMKIVSLASASFLQSTNFIFNGQINKALFIDSSNNYIVIMNSTTASFIDRVALVFLYSVSFVNPSPIIDYDINQGELIQCSDNSLDFYQIKYNSVCCNSNCDVCYVEDICLKCRRGYVVSYGNCIFDTTPQSTTNTSSTTTNSTSNTSEPANSLITYNQSLSNKTSQNEYFMMIIMTDGSILIIDLSAIEQTIINKAADAIKYSNMVLEKFMIFLTSTPYIYFFLSFLQFFTISSLYAFLNVSVPIDIYNALKSTFNSLNSNIFTLLGINFEMPQMGQERTIQNERAQDLGVSTFFIQSNYQFFLLCLAAFLMIIIFSIVTSSLHKKSIIGRLFNQTRQAILTGMIISGMVSFLLPTIFVFDNPKTISFLDKINMGVEFLIIGIVFIFPALYLASIVKTNNAKMLSKKSNLNLTEAATKRSNTFNSSKPKTYFLLKSQKDDFYICFINLSFPGLVLLSNPAIFLFFNQIVLIFGIIKALNAKHYRFNKIILSIYPLIFHICFFIFYWRTEQSILAISTIVCLITYFIGSTHEILTLIAELLYFVFRVMREAIHERIKIKPVKETISEDEEESNKMKKLRFKEYQEQDDRSQYTVFKFSSTQTAKMIINKRERQEIKGTDWQKNQIIIQDVCESESGPKTLRKNQRQRQKNNVLSVKGMNQNQTVFTITTKSKNFNIFYREER